MVIKAWWPWSDEQLKMGDVNITKVTRSRNRDGYVINYGVTVGGVKKVDKRWVFSRGMGDTAKLFPQTAEASKLNKLIEVLQAAVK